MTRPLTLCGITLGLCAGGLFVFASQERTLGQARQAPQVQSEAVEEPSDFDAPNLQLPRGHRTTDDTDDYGGTGFRVNLESNQSDENMFERFFAHGGRSGNQMLNEYLQRRLKEADGPSARESVLQELHDGLLMEFEADIEHRQAELDKIKQRVAEMEAHLEKRAAAKDEIIDLRVQVLVNQAEGLGWSDEPGENRANVFGGGFSRGLGFDAGGLERSLMGRGLERSLMRGGFGSRRGSGFIPPNESEDEQSHPEPVPEETSPE